MPDLQEVFRMATQKVGPDPGALERQQRFQRRTATRRKVGALALAAAIGVAAVVLVLATRLGDRETIPADVTPTVSPVDETPVDATAKETGDRFVEAYGNFDASRAIGFLADEADITGLVESLGGQGTRGTLEEFRLMVSFMEAVGYEQFVDSCQVGGTVETGTSVRCMYDFQFLRSGEIGLGPFSGGNFHLVVRDGEVVRATQYWSGEEFSPAVWEPFAEWVSRAYPQDAALMYADQQSRVNLSEESIRLWEQHTKEYAEKVGRGTAGQ